MKKLIKYLKPYALLAVLCVSLVFLQAMCELKLPDHMSDMVNIGVQRYGIKDAVPERLSAWTLGRLRLFMNAEETAALERNYSADTADTFKLSADMGSEDRETLNAAFTKAFAAVSAVDSGELDLGVTCNAEYAALEMMSESERETLLRSYMEAADMGESVTGQLVAMAIRAEYERLGMDVGAYQLAYIKRTGVKMLGVALLVCAAGIGAGYLGSRIAAGFSRDLRRDVFKKVIGFSSNEINRFSTASLITRTTNDIQQMQVVVTMLFRIAMFAPIMGVGGVIYALRKSVSMSWILVLALIVLIGMLAVIFSVATPRFKIMQKLVDRLNLVTRENLSGIMVSRAYNTQEFEMQRFDRANAELTQNSLFINRVMALMNPVMTIVMNGLTLIIIWAGSHQIARSSMQIGDMMAYMQYAMHVVMSFLFVSMIFIMLPRAAVSGDRVAEILTSESAIRDPETPRDMRRENGGIGTVEFRNVSFKYPDAEEYALKDISFTAKAGETTAFIGSTGSGKSTVMNLIPRFYDVTEGAVMVNGVDVREAAQRELREQIAYVPQKNVLFTGTIEENIKLGAPNAGRAQVERAAEIAQAKDFITGKEHGYEEYISQGGTNVSGGQRQRLAIARALAVDAPIYLFDDSFSALDFKTDAALRKALAKNMEGRTIIIVAQRIGTIKNAEQIIVLDEGRIAGKGTHDELMRSCSVYREIAKSQLREEELA